MIFPTLISAFKPASSGSGVPQLFDTYSGEVHGYALFKLSSSYTGDCLEIRRDNDDATTNVGFDSNDEFSLNSPVSAGGNLGTWIGSNNGFVRSWYNQAEYSNAIPLSFSVTTNQPRIVNAGVVETKNGKPCIISVDATDRLLHGSGYSANIFGTSGDVTGFYVGEVGDLTDGPIETISTNEGFHFQLSTSTNLRFRHNLGTIADFTVSAISGNDQHIFAMFHDLSLTTIEAWIDGTSQGTQTMNNEWGQSQFQWDPDIGGRQVQAIIYFDGDLSANVPTINTELNNYFSVY